MDFEAYKYTPEEIRLRIKDLVEMQRSREEFSEETLAEFEAILKEFVDNTVDKKDDKENIRQSAKAAIRKLNRANKKLDYEFIETDEREELGEFFYMAGSYVGSYVGVDIRKLFDSARDW